MKGTVSFYEKPGCMGNAQQKEKLSQAGYKLHTINMLEKKWEKDDLICFFGSRPVHSCINMMAPQIKSGEFNPQKFNEDELIEEMIKDPILIMRPLIFYRGQTGCGFDSPLVTMLLGEEQEQTSCQHTPGSEVCEPL